MAEEKFLKSNFQWLALEQGAEAKMFDGVSAGTFVDMYGRRLTIAEADLSKMVENTTKVIESTRSESGDLVGLPIDVAGHEHDDAAGWIKGCELDSGRNVIKLIPEWNEIGRDLISGNIRRFFSPTIDTKQKVVMGGSLTNWPASRSDKTGEILLQPIELSKGIVTMTDDIADLGVDESLYARISRIYDAFMDEFATSDYGTYPIDFFENYLIAKADDKLWKVEYSEDEEGELVFTPASEWVEVKKTYVEAGINNGAHFSLFDLFAGLGLRRAKTETVERSEENMTGKDKDVKDVQVDLPQALAIASPDQIAELAKNPDIAKLIEDSADKKIKAARRADGIKEFSAKVSSSEDKKSGLPVPADRMEKFLLSLNEEQLEEAKAIFEHIAKEGFIPMEELGTSKTVKGTKPLPDYMAANLSTWLADNKENTVEEFFEINAGELGDMADYDLSAYEKAKK